jgi:hypothetical protein
MPCILFISSNLEELPDILWKRPRHSATHSWLDYH